MSPPCEAWDPTRADLDEAFLLWATPRAEYAGRTQEEAYAMLTADSPAAARVVPKFFGSPSGSIRDKILTLCENLGASAVGPALRPHAEADSPHLSLVLFCLSRSGDTESLPILLEQMNHRRWQVRASAALSVGYLGQRGAVPDLIRVLKNDTYPMVRKSVAFALGRCSDSATVTPEALDALVSALDDEFFAARFNAIRSLASLADPALDKLRAVYDSLSDTARYGALAVFGRTSAPAARQFLEKTGADTAASPILRGIAVKGLLDQKWTPADTDLSDLRATPVGRGLWGMMR